MNIKKLILIALALTSIGAQAADIKCTIDAKTMAKYHDWYEVREFNFARNPTVVLSKVAHDGSTAVFTIGGPASGSKSTYEATIGDRSFGLKHKDMVLTQQLSPKSLFLMFVPEGSAPAHQIELTLDASKAGATPNRLNLSVRPRLDDQPKAVAVFNCK